MKYTRVLIVDDHQVVRKGVAAILGTRPEWQVCGEASTGREAVEAASRLRPEIVIMDVSMPDMNGLDASRQILQQLPECKILVLSMHESDQLVRELFAAGVRGYVLKSDVDTELMAAMEALRQGKLFSTPKISQTLLRGYAKGSTLSPRERQIVQLVAEGKSSKEVAAALHISPKTVETHRAHIMDKLALNSLADLVRYAIRNHIIEC